MTAVNVITNSQLQRIKEKISPPPTTDKSKYLLSLHEKSKQRAEGWPNTLEMVSCDASTQARDAAVMQAQRHRKDRARKERLAALEAVRQQQDRVVAEDKERQRRATLERVNKMIFHETDSAKGFHGAALHCDVLAERAAQIEFKQQIATLRSAQNEAYHRQMREQVELAEDAEVAKLIEARDRAMEQKAAQMQQLDDMKARILADRAAYKAEGEEVKVKAQTEMQAERERVANARARARDANDATAKANEALKEYKRQQEKMVEEQEASRIAYLEQKERLAAQRKEKEASIAAEKEARRKAMAEIMEAKFKALMSSEAERLDRDVKHAEEKQAAEAQARAERRRAQWNGICQSREQQLASKEAHKEAARAADKEFAAAWKERMQQLVDQELADADQKRARNVHVAAFQKHQCDLKTKKKCVLKHAALQEAAMVEELTNDADMRFKQYAKEFIEEYQRQGKPIRPMQIMLNKPKPLESA